jgi:hypothetical protein
MGTVPSTGTHIHLVSDEVLGELLRPYADQVFYLGRVYGSKPKLPLWFKHFDRGADGAGEAYHLGIFGKTGSGKSVLGKMILLAYARYPQMALLVIDPQGEFAGDLREGSTGEFQLPMGGIIKSLGKTTATLTVRNLVLDRWELFVEILFESPFFERLTVPKGENRQIACDVLADKLRKKVNLKDLYQPKSFQEAWKLLADEKIQRQFYRTEASRTRFNTALQEAEAKEFYEEYWRPVAELFREDRPQARTVRQALSWLLNPKTAKRLLLVIDLSREQAKDLFWNDRIQALVIKRLLDGLTQTAEYFFKERQSLNALLIIDEAHRLAPPGVAEGGRRRPGSAGHLAGCRPHHPQVRPGVAVHQPDLVQPGHGDRAAVAHLLFRLRPGLGPGISGPAATGGLLRSGPGPLPAFPGPPFLL